MINFGDILNLKKKGSLKVFHPLGSAQISYFPRKKMLSKIAPQKDTLHLFKLRTNEVTKEKQKDPVWKKIERAFWFYKW